MTYKDFKIGLWLVAIIYISSAGSIVATYNVLAGILTVFILLMLTFLFDGLTKEKKKGI